MLGLSCSPPKTFIFLLFPISLFSQAWTCGDTILDLRDGLSYNTVQIGSQCWMAQNLNYGQHILSHDSAFLHSEAINNGVIEKYCLGNDPTNCQDYGGLYDWNEMMEYSTTENIQGVCPGGWYLPSDNEWNILILHLDGDAIIWGYNSSQSYIAGGMMKSIGTIENVDGYWYSPNGGASNESGFRVIGSTK